MIAIVKHCRSCIRVAEETNVIFFVFVVIDKIFGKYDKCET